MWGYGGEILYARMLMVDGFNTLHCILLDWCMQQQLTSVWQLISAHSWRLWVAASTISPKIVTDLLVLLLFTQIMSSRLITFFSHCN